MTQEEEFEKDPHQKEGLILKYHHCYFHEVEDVLLEEQNLKELNNVVLSN